MNTLSTLTNEHKTISYQTPSVQHASQLESFFLNALESNFAYFPEEAQASYRKSWKNEVLARRLSAKNDLLLCAWSGEDIVGMVSGTTPEGGVGTIIWLTVAPAYQNCKIGAALLSQAKDYYKTVGAHKIKLTVHDKKAKEFYVREGLAVESLHTNHWWKLDFWAMAYFLTD